MLEEELLRVAKESKISRKVLGALNSTFICLIPKENEPSFFEELRPISVCNLTYKLISKIIANILNGILSSIISKQ